ncbi:uncharacterized protein Z518_09180 [Rhinocladiella mackenziei CBS 650.93]|uniref:DUF7924 domain-containing protein n=1 Tax=Rhinocladiella mackenziei CBS 650.93 TaxID=1442369 RepID=A0A0D2I6M9_9EURO|nr:uncharacterized protein Z518_09180 [Rhinocladiella mackenziei CBS 650.93]KIX01454.1 hypothetical protein Z518_09180 [Rhinocladiella mackenziei CBS 650.93]
MTSRRVQQQPTQNTSRKKSRRQFSNRLVSPGVKLAAHGNQSIEVPRPPPRYTSSRRLSIYTNHPPGPSSPVAGQPSKQLTLPPPDIEIPIPDTSPRRIHVLWQLVIPPKKGQLPSNIPTRALPQRSRAERRKASQTTEVETATDSQSIQDDALTAITKDTTVSKITAVEKWRLNVLVPRGIQIVKKPVRQLALDHFQYFGTDETQCREWTLKRVESEKDEDTVFLRGGPHFNMNIARQYTEMVAIQLCEEEFATVAKAELLKSPHFLPIEEKDKTWKAQRLIQLYTQTDADSFWATPPLLSGEEYRGKDFNLRPDCAYWLSIQSFSESHRELVDMATFTVRNRYTAPYLTIEFKKSENTIEQATNQAIAASSLALFNRFRLKEDRLSTSKKPWNRKHFDQIRHYMMTFTGPMAMIWVVKLKSSAASDESYSQVTWDGCEAVQIWKCNCTKAGAVGDLVDYINAIHRWGLIHGAYCRRDVKAVLLAEGGGVARRVSDLYVSGDPIEDDENEVSKE